MDVQNYIAMKCKIRKLLPRARRSLYAIVAETFALFPSQIYRCTACDHRTVTGSLLVLLLLAGSGSHGQ